MSKVTLLHQEKMLSANIQAAVVSLQEVSVMRMQRVRSAVLQTRAYQTGLLSVFSDLKHANQSEIEQLLKPHSWWSRKVWQVQTRQTNGRKVAVLSSPDQRFAGTIATEVFDLFIKELTINPKTDCLVIGQVGRDLFTSHFGEKKDFTFYDFKEAHLETTSQTALVDHLLQYQHVTLYHGQFKSFASQVPLQLSLTATDSLLSSQSDATALNKAQTPTKFLFEPDLQKIISFFETEVFTILLKLALHESRLAHLGSRITALESSNQSLTETNYQLTRTHLHAKKQLTERKQRQRLAGQALWS